MIEEGLSYVKEIASYLLVDEFAIYFGQIPEKNFSFSFYYGKYSDGVIIQNDVNASHNSNKI